MIGWLSGKLLVKRPPMVLVEVGGVGYELEVSMTTFYQLPAVGGAVSLHTHLVVREDAHLLYGFADDTERKAFRQLLRISGVGAKVALAVLSGLNVNELAHAISAQDDARLTKIPGIGKKTAQRLLLEMRDKLPVSITLAPGQAAVAPDGHDALNALLSLGYNQREADWAIGQLSRELGVAEMIRQALKLLSKT
ncbi:MAG: Holliday junction branch migration protein RuvA [Burkholderiales bacterium]